KKNECAHVPPCWMSDTNAAISGGNMPIAKQSTTGTHRSRPQPKAFHRKDAKNAKETKNSPQRPQRNEATTKDQNPPRRHGDTEKTPEKTSCTAEARRRI